jgi:hypothetical protein
MSETVQAQLTLLKDLYEQGMLSEKDYQAKLADLGVDPATVFDQKRQHVSEQINVAGDYIDQRQMTPEPGADPTTLRRAYLHRLLETTSQLSLAGVDPKAASEAKARLNLGAVYTALLTQRLEIEVLSRDREVSQVLIEKSNRHLSAVEILNRDARLVLLGDPGSGKSTLVNFVAMCLAGEMLGSEQANLKLLTAPLPDDEGQDQDEAQPWRHEALLLAPGGPKRHGQTPVGLHCRQFGRSHPGRLCRPSATRATETRRPAVAGWAGRGARGGPAPSADQTGGGGFC